MTYTGIPSDSGPPQAPISQPENAYTQMGKFPQGLYVLRGTILAGFQGAQYYDVATDFGRYLCISLGSGRGMLGANEAAGYLPGEQVWIAASPSNPAFNAFIIGKADFAYAGAYTPACDLLVHPQVAGFSPGEMYSGARYSDFPRIRNFNSGIRDSVDGDWIMHNMFGGAIGVEAFRTFLQAGPAAGIHAYTEDGHLRIIGARFERLTFTEQYEDRQLGTGNSQVGRKVFYPGDAMSDFPHQLLEVTGPAYSGEQSYYSYPANANLGQGSADGASGGRIALLHEYRGMDGNFMLSAAGSITLRKSFRIPMPEYAGATEEDDDPDTQGGGGAVAGSCEPCPLSKDTIPKSAGTGANASSVAQSPFGESDDGDNSGISIGALDAILDATVVRGRANALIEQALSGFRRLSAWTVPDSEPASGLEGEPTPLISRDPNMWKCAPQLFELALDPYNASKNYVWGDAIIQITPEGSIVLQSAQGDTLVVGAGNIAGSCQHDVTFTAGRNIATFAGRDIGIRAGRHVDVNANYGRMTLVCASQFSILGGMDGNGGVLIESKGQYHGAMAGENPPSSGGVILKSAHYVGLDAGLVDISARHPTGWSAREGGAGIINLSADALITWETEDGNIGGSFGSVVTMQLADSTCINFGPTSIFTGRVAMMDSIFYNTKMFRVPNPATFLDKASQLCVASQQVHEKMTRFSNYPVEVSEDINVKWFTGAQRNINGSNDFMIPEPEWQVRAKEVYQSDSMIINTSFSQYSLDGTRPFPGDWSAAMFGYEIEEGNYFAPDRGPGAAIAAGSPTSMDNLFVGI